jgi:hypothetical protein
MSAVACDYTVVLSGDSPRGEPACDYIVTDGGVLFATSDHGAIWTFFGLVDPETFLLDLGFEEAWEITKADGARGASAARRFMAS